MTPALDRDAIVARLPAMRTIGREIQVFGEVDSTNDVVARAGALGAAEGLVVLAETQRAGRGRLGRVWASPPGVGLWFSLLLRPSRGHAAPLAFWAALAVSEAIDGAAGREMAAIKWPNDILVSGRKVAGTLIETHGDYAVAGIGINVNQSAADFPEELRSRGGSLAMALGTPVDRVQLVASVLTNLEALYAGWPGNRREIITACARKSALDGRRVTARTSEAGASGLLDGIVEGLDEDGRLLVRDSASGRLIALVSGEITVQTGLCGY